MMKSFKILPVKVEPPPGIRFYPRRTALTSGKQKSAGIRREKRSEVKCGGDGRMLRQPPVDPGHDVHVDSGHGVAFDDWDRECTGLGCKYVNVGLLNQPLSLLVVPAFALLLACLFAKPRLRSRQGPADVLIDVEFVVVNESTNSLQENCDRWVSA
jgi:hypothetical protein